jgi:hypothetical protein
VGPPTTIADCERRLKSANITFGSVDLPIIRRGNSASGAYQAVLYDRCPEKMRVIPTPIVSCPLARALARFETLLQRIALEYWSQRVKIGAWGTYNCRSMARLNILSEYSYAYSIEIYEITLNNGKRTNVHRHSGSTTKENVGKEGKFL